MNLNIYIENDAFGLIDNKEEESLCRSIAEFDETIQKAEEHGDTLFSDRGFYYIQISKDYTFSDWLFSTQGDSPKLKEKKILLSKVLEQSNRVDSALYADIQLIVDKQNMFLPNFKHSDGFITIFKDNRHEWYISNIEEWSRLHRIYLQSSVNINDFVDSLEVCFLNLYFNDQIKTTLKSLNHKFSDLMYEIIKHLTEINDYFDEFVEFRKGTGVGYRLLAQAFTAATGIDCGPQAGRETTQQLVINISNEDGKIEELRCELHTKFPTYNGDPEKQDRLYFHPGKENIANGKIIIFHIGDHA